MKFALFIAILTALFAGLKLASPSTRSQIRKWVVFVSVPLLLATLIAFAVFNLSFNFSPRII